MAPSAGQGGRDASIELLAAKVESLTSKVGAVETKVDGLQRHLSGQDEAMKHLAETQVRLSESQKILLDTITGGLEPKKGVQWKLEKLTEWMEASKGNQKWIVRTAIGALITGIGLSAGAILLAYLHLPTAK